MDVREICQMAIEEISGIAVPQSYAGSVNLTAKLALRLATRSGRHFALEYPWSVLREEYVFTTVVGQQSYDLPTGFRSFSHLSYWDNTNLDTVQGPVSARLWAALRRGLMVQSAFNKYFFITNQSRKITIWPVPTAEEEISFFYYSKLWVDINSDGVGERERFQDDADVPLIDADLISLDLKWRFRKAKGLDWEAEYQEAMNLRDTLLTADSGSVEMLDFSGTMPLATEGSGGSIPTTIPVAGPMGPAGPQGPPGEPGGGDLLISAIYPPTPDPEVDGAEWFDPSTGEVWVWYNGEWVETGTIAPESPTPLTGGAVTVAVGPVAMLIKLLDLPVPYFDGGNSYWSQFTNASAAGWGDPSFFPLGVFLSPGSVEHSTNLAAAGMNYMDAVERDTATNTNLVNLLAAGVAVMPHLTEWSPDDVDAQNGDNNPLVVGWHIDDEPDMNPSRGLATVQTRVALVEGYDDGRFTKLGIGLGVTGLPLWAPTTTDDMVQAVDFTTVDMYFYSAPGIRAIAVTSPYWTGSSDPDEARRSAAYGWLCDRMQALQAADEKKPYGAVIETALPLIDTGTDAGYGDTFGLFNHPEIPHITLPQISAASWSTIRHGARGIQYFQHNNNGRDPFYSVSDDDGTVIRGHMAAMAAEILSFAEIIEGPTYEWDFGDDDIETMLKAHAGYAYIFAGVSITAPFPGVGASDIEQTGTTLEFSSTATTETGTVSSTITVPDNAELVVVTVSGQHGTNNGFDAMTFTKGASDTAMTKATGGDASGASWQGAIFYLDLPDTGVNKSLKWDWLGAPAAGPRIFSVSFWRGIDLSESVRDSNGTQDTGFLLETPTLVETPDLAAATGDKMFALCAMKNPDADGSAAVNVWHHAARLGLFDPTHSGIAEASLATGTPDGDCTIGFENISAATEAAVVALTMKAATLEAVTTTIEQTGAVFNTNTGGTLGNTGTFFALATVPADCDFVLAAVTGFTGNVGGFETITMPKGAVDTAMVRLTGGDTDGTMWQTALFYMVAPDTGASKAVKWDWLGSAAVPETTTLSLTYWKGVDPADPVRDSAGLQNRTTFPVELPMLTNREGDRVVAFYGGYTASAEGTVDEWKNVTTLEQLTHEGTHDGAWATAEVIGSLRVAVNEVTAFTEGSLVAAVLRPAAAVTPITPAADPPTTPRTVVTGTFTLPPDLAAATTVEVLNESRSISVTAGVFTDTFDEEWSYHNYRVAIP